MSEPSPVRTARVVRLMMTDDGELPRAGVGFDKLGVRPRDPADTVRKKKYDVAAETPDDLVGPVDPETGLPQGMSCSKADRETYLSRRKRPLERKQRVWEIDAARLPDGLAVIDDPLPGDPDHALVVPTRPVALATFQALLASTRPLWRVVESR